MTWASAAWIPLNVTNWGTGLSLRINDDGTYTDSTPFAIANDGKVWIGLTSMNTLLDINGDIAYRIGTDYTTTGTANDVSLSSNTSSTVRYAGSAVATITGIAWWQNGKILNLMNASSFILTLSNQWAWSTAANRIITGNGQDLLLAPDQTTLLQYDSTASRWRIIDSTSKKYSYRLTSAQTSVSSTPADVTSLVTGTLPIWVYKMTTIAKFQTALLTTGIWLTLTQKTATITNVAVNFTAQSAATSSQQLSIIASWTNVTTTWVAAANTDYVWYMVGTFEVTVAWTVAIQLRTEVNTSQVTLQPGTYFQVEALY